MKTTLKWLIGWVLCIGLAACGQSIALTGNQEPTQFQGLSVDGVDDVHDYINANGAEALGVDPHTDWLSVVQDVNFVYSVFPCDVYKGTTYYCYGLTDLLRLSGRTQTTVARVQADATFAPTDIAGCTALGHEYMHSLLFAATGDGDVNHTRNEMWGPEGVVVKALEELCPTWTYTSQQYNAP